MFFRKNNNDKEDGTEEAASGEKSGKSSGRFLGRRVPPSILSSDVRMLGNLISEGVIDIDGHIDGNVRALEVILRKNGRVRGDVVAEKLHIYGEVDGMVRARDVEMFEGAKVIGTIIHEKLAIEDGATIDGQLKRINHVVLDESKEPEHISVMKRFKLLD